MTAPTPKRKGRGKQRPLVTCPDHAFALTEERGMHHGRGIWTMRYVCPQPGCKVSMLYIGKSSKDGRLRW